MSRQHPSHEGHAPDSPADVRPLPARPSLEFERKQAKKLLRQLKKAEPEALARVHAKLKQSVDTKPDEYQLSDAQFTIAREYGFTSWPKLVEYFTLLARHEVSGGRRLSPEEGHENEVRRLPRYFAARFPWVASAITRFVPRFQGRSSDEVFASVISEEEWRLVSARMHRFPSWQAMIETPRPTRDRWRDDSPKRRAFRAIHDRDLTTLKALIAANPELGVVSNAAEPWASSVIYNAIHSEVRGAGSEGFATSDWLASTDIDLKPTLNWLLLGFMRMKTEQVQWLLDHGADPSWMPPNGISILEHALYRYWNGEAIDLIVRRVKPRQALWIAAGIGDVAAVRSYFDTAGKLTARARTSRPDFTAMDPFPGPPTFGDADVDILWEAFLIAAWNDRYRAMDVLLQHGLPIDYTSWDQPVIGWGIFEARPALVEFLVARGATVDDRIRGSAEELFAQRQHEEPRRRIMELVGGRDPEVVLQEYEERRDQRVMQTQPDVEKAFDFAKLDAKYLGLTAVSPENLFVGLMRQDGLPVYPVVHSGVDLLKLRAAFGARFETKGEPPADMTADDSCAAILMAGRKEAEDRKNPYYTTVHMFYALMKQPPESVLRFIRESGGDPEKVIAETEKIFDGMG